MQKSGRTPLMRARKLEKLLQVGEIYIKLEGANPSGHKHDRIAEVLVKDAKAHGQNIILVDGSYSYIKSVKYFAEIEEVDVRVPVFSNEKWKSRKFAKEELIRMSRSAGSHRTSALRDYALEVNAYLAIEGYTSTHLSLTALEVMASEVMRKMDYRIDNIFIQLGYGYTLTSIYSSMLRSWIDGRIEHYPRVVCGTWEHVNKVFENYKKTSTISEKSYNEHTEDAWTAEQTNIDKQLLEESLKAVEETNGTIQPVDDELLKEAAKLLRKYEQIKIKSHEAYPFAAFYKLAQSGKIEKGRHVIILNEAKSAVKVENINDYDDELTKEKLIDYTRTWLAQYSDSVLETEEAVQNAMEKGFILLASRNDAYEGICVVVNMGYDHFHPKYHLAYVGTDKTSKGRGVATELIQRALDLSEGSLSLHVDLDNKGAKKLYEKLGFKHCYNRMIYYGE